MDGDTRWKMGCWAATSVASSASAILYAQTNPALTGLYLSISALSIICMDKEYKKFKKKEKEKKIAKYRFSKEQIKEHETLLRKGEKSDAL